MLFWDVICLPGDLYMKEKMILETERLFLREMTEEDYDELYVILADSDIMQHYQWKNQARDWVSYEKRSTEERLCKGSCDCSPGLGVS